MVLCGGGDGDGVRTGADNTRNTKSVSESQDWVSPERDGGISERNRAGSADSRNMWMYTVASFQFLGIRESLVLQSELGASFFAICLQWDHGRGSAYAPPDPHRWPQLQIWLVLDIRSDIDRNLGCDGGFRPEGIKRLELSIQIRTTDIPQNTRVHQFSSPAIGALSISAPAITSIPRASAKFENVRDGSCLQKKNELTLNLFDRSLEPLPGAQQPKAWTSSILTHGKLCWCQLTNRIRDDNPDSNDRIIQSL